MLHFRTAARVPLTLWRTWGFGGILRRCRHELRRATGRFRSAPRWAAAPSPPAELYRVDADRVRAAAAGRPVLAGADRVLAGEHHAYGGEWRRLPAGDRWF